MPVQSPDLVFMFEKNKSARFADGNPELPRSRFRYNRPMPHNKADRDFEAEAAGQSGDTQGISDAAEADSESVDELLEEGQPFEAGIVSGVEHAPDPDVAEVTTKEVPEDDVPQEYLDRD